MPYRSRRQEMYLRANKPDVAAKYDAHEAENAAVTTEKFETETTGYNWRSRNNLKRGRGAKLSMPKQAKAGGAY